MIAMVTPKRNGQLNNDAYAYVYAIHPRSKTRSDLRSI